MTSTRKMLLGTAAATIAVTAGVDTGAQAADAALKKAPPIQYVRICDRYGYGFFQIPGSSICLQLRGQLQSDNDYQPTKDLVFVSPSKTSGSYGGGAPAQAANANVQFANQQDNWGYEVTAKPRFDARTETSMGTMRAYAELKIQLDAGAFNGPPGPGAGETGAGNKSELYRGYLQWAGWTIGNADSIYSLGAMKDGDIANVTHSDKSSGWTVNYTWTPTGPGLPPVKGSAPVPDGWSCAFGVDTPLKHIAKNQIGGGCTYYDLAIAGANAVGSGNVCAATGPLSIPDFVARLHYEADPPGKDDQHNDQFGIGTFHLAGLYHQITQIAVGGSGLLNSTNGFPGEFCGTGTCAAGPTVHDHGFAVNAHMKFFVPMWPGTTLGARRGSDSDNLQFNVLYCDGALEGCGIGGTNGNLSVGDAYWSGGLSRDDTDSRIINNGAGSFYNDKEKALSTNAQYHWALTNCSDAMHCLVATAMATYTWVTPGNITQNVDWTEGGLGKAQKLNLTAELSWGISRNGSTRSVGWRLDSEVQYSKVWATLPCANNGLALAVCGTPTAIPLGITKDPSNFVYRATITMDW
jgi:Porin subfamily